MASPRDGIEQTFTETPPEFIIGDDLNESAESRIRTSDALSLDLSHDMTLFPPPVPRLLPSTLCR